MNEEAEWTRAAELRERPELLERQPRLERKERKENAHHRFIVANGVVDGEAREIVERVLAVKPTAVRCGKAHKSMPEVRTGARRHQHRLRSGRDRVKPKTGRRVAIEVGPRNRARVRDACEGETSQEIFRHR